MKTQIITILGIVLMISLVSAIYPGDVNIKDLSSDMETYSNYTITGNTSAINISVNNLIATIVIPVDYMPGDFEITFFGYKAGSIVEEHYSPSSSSGSYIYPGTKPITNTTNETEEDTIVEDQVISEPEPIVEPEEKGASWFILVLILMFIILVIILITWYFANKRSKY